MSEEEHRDVSGVSRRQFVQLVTAASAAGGLGSGAATAATDDADDADAAELVEEMTLDEKVSRTHGAEGGPEGIAGYLGGIERLDVPGMGMADGPPGASLGDPTTAFPHPIAAAATFDPELSSEMGAAIAREVKSGGVEVLLAPSMDTFRVPLHARSGETYGEDPELASAMAAAYTGAVQSEGVVATLKHFACYNQTSTTGDVNDYFSFSEHDVVVDERALREIYFRPFEAAVTEGGAGAVMPAYNRINGTFCSENETLLRDVLKGEWGFEGFVVSDWFGTHSTVKAAENGLDVEMPSEEYFGESLREAVESGELDESVVDEMVRRTLASRAEVGALSGDREGSDPVRGTDEHFELAEQIAAEGSVLLQNDSDCLPLDGDAVGEIAVVGPTPTEFKPSVGGSDHIDAIRRIGLVEGLETVGGDVTVTAVATDRYEPAGPEGFAPESGDGEGFTAEYFATENWSGDPVRTRVEAQVDLTESDVEDIESDAVSVRWSGTLTAPSTGAFGLELTSQERGAVYVDGEAVVRSEGGGFFGPKTEEAAVELEAGAEYDVRVEARGVAPVSLEWNRPESIADAADAAESADAAIVLAKTDTFYGDDRHEYELPGNQNALVESVAAANDRTAVCLNTEAPVAMPWADDVPSILQVWFPGQEGGTAVADLLFGNVTPSGKTPVTYAEHLEDYLPQEMATLPEDGRGYPGVDGTVYYDEGVFVGYRHFDEHGVEPQFPFGHGESYTDFEYSALGVAPKVKNRNKETVKATVKVQNTGDCEGAEVVQLYVGDRDASVDRPPKELKAFEKVWLSPGEETTVEFELAGDAFSFYHPDEGWTVEAGEFDVLVGGSSRDIRCTDRVVVRENPEAKAHDSSGGETTADD